MHDRLLTLRTRRGPEVFQNADGFRAALNDVLSEKAASDGEINLLVDAVRLGAVAMMVNTIATGGQPALAVQAAGDHLSRQRGTTDVDGSRWACAAIGYALGKVPESDLSRFKPTVSGLTNSEREQRQKEASRETAAVPGVGAMATAGPESDPAPGPTPDGEDRKRSRLAVLIGVGVLVLALVGSGVTYVLLNRGPSTALPAVNERFSGLASDVTKGMNTCESVDPPEGETKRVSCTFAEGALVLSEFETESAFEAARDSIVNTARGNRYSAQDSGVFFSRYFDAEIGNDFLYWDDNKSMQSGKYEASENPDDDVYEVETLHRLFKNTKPTLTFPAQIENEALQQLVERFNVKECIRIETNDPQELEESNCDGLIVADVFAAVNTNLAAMKEYRVDQISEAKAAGGRTDTWGFTDDKSEGQTAQWVDPADDVPTVYWDQESCTCYMVIIGDPGDSLKSQVDWWKRGLESESQ